MEKSYLLCRFLEGMFSNERCVVFQTLGGEATVLSDVHNLLIQEGGRYREPRVEETIGEGYVCCWNISRGYSSGSLVVLSDSLFNSGRQFLVPRDNLSKISKREIENS